MLANEVKAISFLQSLPDDFDRIAVSFSGGKDSLVALDLAIRVGIKKAVFADTTIEFEETKEYIKTVSDFYGITIDTTYAPRDFFEVAMQVGFPSRRFRWCCDVFKFSPLMKYARLKHLDAFITGLRREESFRRHRYLAVDSNPVMPIKQVNLLLDWSEKEIWEYIKTYNLPVNTLYNHFKRIGCWCCPYRTNNDWKVIEKLHPEKIQKLDSELLKYAEMLGINDKKRFIEGKGWTVFAPPIRRISVGIYSLCDGKDDKLDLILSTRTSAESRRIKKLLPIISNDFFVFDNEMRVRVNQRDKKKLNTLLEKAINCIGCEACVSLCPTGALGLDEESLFVEKEKCNHCYRCLHTKILRGACIVRNYSPKRASYLKRDTINNVDKPNN